MNREEMRAMLQAAAAIGIDGADDALKKFDELNEAVTELEQGLKDVRKALKKVKKALD